MNAAFPFGFPAPTALYLTLYALTFAVHLLFMQYVLGGSCYLAVSALLRGQNAPAPEPGSTRYKLQDWLPFGVGLTITAGVAPLLFLQVLFEHRFYTANLLLFHRWMAIVPVLIIGFYLLYLGKSSFARLRPRLRQVAAVIAAACFLFVGWSWIDNHLLSRDSAAWIETFASGRMTYNPAETIPRLLVGLFSAAGSMGLIVGWQLHASDRDGARTAAQQHRALARFVIGGLLLAVAAAFAYGKLAPFDVAAVLLSRLCIPFTILAAAGLGAQLLSWLWLWLGGSQARRLQLVVASVGLAATLVGMSVIHEALRLSAFNISTLYERHAQAARAGGFPLFVVMALLAAGIIGFAVRVGARAAREGEAESTPS